MALFIDEESQNSVLGLMVLNQDVTTQGLIAAKRGIYYSRLFIKPSNHVWYQLNMTSNESTANFQNIDIDVRYRTGNLLPIKDYATNARYTFDEFNTYIKNNDPSMVDQLLYRWVLGRSLLGVSGTSTTVSSASNEMIEYGTATNTTQLAADRDAAWNYWSVPNLGKRFYVAHNTDYQYIQLRIDMTSLDRISPVEVYKIVLSSLLKKGS